MTAKTAPGRGNSMRRLVPSLLLATLACLAIASPAVALDINPADYFQLTYQPVTFDKSQVAGGELFHTTIRGRAVCSKSIPLPVSEATITSQVIARDATGAGYTLNPGFVIDIKPFPDKAGETFDIDVTIDLQFPGNAPPGRYDVVWQPIEARAKVSFIWTDISDYFPAEQQMGQVNVIPGPPPTGAASAPASSVTRPATTGTPRAPGFVVPWWAFPLGVVVVIAVIVIVIVLLVRRRR